VGLILRRGDDMEPALYNILSEGLACGIHGIWTYSMYASVKHSTFCIRNSIKGGGDQRRGYPRSNISSGDR